MKFLQWLKMVLRRFRAQGVHYIGGSGVLPPPLSPEEEAAAVEANSEGDVAARNRLTSTICGWWCSWRASLSRAVWERKI